MLSILIPTYNYNVFPLVSEIRLQCLESQTVFEIVVLDDASALFQVENNAINDFESCSYEMLPTNIGRSRIRNLLAKRAKFDWLLFLDSDVFPKDKLFIAKYLSNISGESKAINGGILYQEQKPETDKLLRWTYGSKREALTKQQRNQNPYLAFLTLNFLIHKSIFDHVRFNETIPNLRHEDTLFSFDLKQANIKVAHIENPVIHYGIDSFDAAIRKENDSLIALKYLLDHKLLASDYLKMARYYTKIRKFGLTPIFAALHRATRSVLLKNLSGENPSLFIFDLYRLGYLFTIKTGNN